MRSAMLAVLVIVAGFAAKAQFSLLPQVGFENTKTNISYNNQEFSPMGVKFSPQASLRLEYKIKQGHGAFLGIGTSRSLVNFSFTDPEAGMNVYTASAGDMQFRFEGGYQFNTKPISLNKSRQASTKTEVKKNCVKERTTSRCGKTNESQSRCGSKSKQAQKSKGSWMRIQPSVGMAFVPSMKDNIVSKLQNGQASYEYRAGNWKTALVAGAGFEFGRNNNRLFTVSLNYFNALGNGGKQTLTTSEGGKTVVTQLSSETTGWNMKVGIPFSLAKTKASKHKPKSQEQKRCGEYKIMYRCGKK
jgi:hypothetical protein